MMKNLESDRDQSIERLLRDTLEAPGASSPPGPCLDAETAAAWADETLGPRERSAAEAHAADCARCQALLAAMVKTSQPTVAKSWWRVPTVGWLVPLTAAATGVIVWAVLPGRAKLETDNRAIAAVNTVADAVAPPAASTPQALELEGRLQRQTAASSAPPGVNVPVSSQLGRRGTSDEKPTSAVIEKDVPASTQAKSLSDNTGIAAAATAQSTRASEESAAPPAASPAVPTRSAVDSPGPSAAALAPSPRSEAKVLAAAPSRAAAPVAAARTSIRALAAVPETSIVSSNPTIRWRIVPGSPGSTVQRSMDGGSSWQRIAFPETTDLVSVRATDDKTATVTASDGRTFSTSDGGLNWVRSPPRDR